MLITSRKQEWYEAAMLMPPPLPPLDFGHSSAELDLGFDDGSCWDGADLLTASHLLPIKTDIAF